MPKNWNKGLTKETNISVRKISQTMKKKHIDNFHEWRERMKIEGKIKSTYPALKRDGDLAELIGVVLGDGHICKFPRTECLRIVADFYKPNFIKRYVNLVEKKFNKKPYVSKRKNSNAVDITIYEKYLSKRLGVPTGARLKLTITIPSWIRKNKKYLIRYLRGLYEAEGSIHHHKKTCTHKLLFSNVNISMLNNVYESLLCFGIAVHRSKDKIQVSRKAEVQKAVNLLQFRVY